MLSQTAVWYSTGFPPAPIRWVLIRDPRGTFTTQAVLCTDLEAAPLHIVSWFILRWQLERGFAFLKDPLFLASSVFIKKPQRIVALSLVMLLCLLVYRLAEHRLAEHRLRERLAATGQAVPSQVKQPTERPTLRWMFQWFEGISLVHFLPPHGPPQDEITGVEPLHEQVIRLLGPFCEKRYELAV